MRERIKDIQTEVHYQIHDNFKKRWDIFSENADNENLFQSSVYFEFLIKFNSYKPFVIIVSNDSGKILGLLSAVIIKDANRIKNFFSRRIIVTGGPLYIPSGREKIEITDILLIQLGKIAQKEAIYTEFRNLVPIEDTKLKFLDSGYIYEDHLNYIVEIKGKDSYQNIHKTKIRQIKKSLKSGAQIGVPETVEELRSFYSILKELYFSKIKKPLPPFQYFHAFYESDQGVFLLIKYQGEIWGGIMCGVFKNTIYELFIAGLDRKSNDLFPSVLATYAAIEYAVSKGIRYFDFMGAGKPDEKYGVREFKSRFGGVLVNPGRSGGLINLFSLD